MVITQRRKLGRSGLEVSPLSFGGNVFGWTIDENSSFEILDNFIAVGGNFIDTEYMCILSGLQEILVESLRQF
ncbi:MAG: hypothetical protein V7L00_19830 [Nostoc sp.]|uniref:hypothetical protein n=1 Tax=Nostoc sp. TaxID=1180 RepID=UPI002FF5C9C9